jgi:uncharacterized protein (DUF58 family)
MRSSKAFWIGAVAILCVVAGIYMGSGGMIALSLPLIMYLAAMSFFRHQEDTEIFIERRLSETRIMAGDAVEVELVVKNLGNKVELLEVFDAVPDYLTLTSGCNGSLLCIEKGEEVKIRYALECQLRGRYVFENVKIRMMDSGRLHCVEKIVKLVSEFSVAAMVEPVKGIKIVPKKTRNWVGMIKARRVGIGTEFFGIREYVSGDELRKINWKASGKYDRLLTNEFESECSGDVTIILDARMQANVGDVVSNTVEHGVRAASTIATQILRDKNRVGLIVLRDIIDEVFPAFGKRQFYKLSEHLLDVKPLGLLPFENVGWVVRSYFPLESQILVISALTDREIIQTIGDLCARGYDVVVISPEPLRLEGAIINNSESKELALRILAMERQNLISDLRRYARIIDWDTCEPLAKALKGVEISRPRR